MTAPPAEPMYPPAGVPTFLLPSFFLHYGVYVSFIGEDGQLVALGHHGNHRAVNFAFNRHALVDAPVDDWESYPEDAPVDRVWAVETTGTTDGDNWSIFTHVPAGMPGRCAAAARQPPPRSPSGGQRSGLTCRILARAEALGTEHGSYRGTVAAPGSRFSWWGEAAARGRRAFTAKLTGTACRLNGAGVAWEPTKTQYTAFVHRKDLRP